MLNPPLYKFLDIEGALKTLENRTLKYACPSDFYANNDKIDMKVEDMFSIDIQDVLEYINKHFINVIITNINKTPTQNFSCITLLQEVLRKNPRAVENLRSELAKNDLKEIYNIQTLEKTTEEVLKDINTFLQNYRVLCVSTDINSDRMWKKYAENHQGIAIRIMPAKGKNSNFVCFKKIKYVEKRPPLFENIETFLEQALFDDHDINLQALNNIIYTKTKDWEYESEYRLAVPLLQYEQSWNTRPYHPEEIIELYLGANISEEHREKCIRLARTHNPKIDIFKIDTCQNDYVSFKPWDAT